MNTSKLPIATDKSDSKADALARISASARKIDERMDHAAATVEREAADKDTKLKHIERYAITPFGYFPPLF